MSVGGDTPGPSPTPLPASPYVGMRPYEAGEQTIFFGRDRDAALLRDKIFSARLTVLYGPSGIGKSSILRTLVVPRVVEEEARAIYFDEWRGADPAAALRARLVEEATRLGVPDPGAGSPTLTDLARLLIAVDDRTLVLILDQFEEFFTSPDHQLEPLRTELAALVRTPGLDARVLISLREEHLAALEPFRTPMVTLFQSTYRLEPLAGDNVRQAIEAPAGLFAMRYEPGLVDRLVHDLRPEHASAGGAEADPDQLPVDLPMLQLVCDELWKHARAREVPVITGALYDGLGGRHGILGAYLRLVMPLRRRERELTATLMRHLAPPDGHKTPFTAGHLAAITELRVDAVQAELARLAEARVLRTRRHEHGSVLYELSHDSFVRILAPWRDQVLAGARRRRRWLQAGSVTILIVAVASSAFWLKDRREMHDNTDAVMRRDDLITRAGREKLTPEERDQVAQRFDHVASYLLWSRSGPGRLDRLRALLVAHRQALPTTYGVDLSGLDFVTLPDARDDWPLVFHYSAARKLDQYIFTLQWQKLARYLNESWGIPVPLRLRLQEERTFPSRLVRLSGREIEPLEFEVGLHEADAFLSSAALPRPGTEFLERFRGEWRPIPEPKHGGPWWIVPRWSLPAWRAAGVTANDGHGLLAFLLTIQLQQHPERMVTPAAVDLLLERVATRHPHTVAEARRVRGDRLARDLQEVVKQGRPLTGLVTTLEILAQYPDGAPADIAGAVSAAADAPDAVMPSKLVLRGRTPAPAGSGAARTIHPAYRDVEKWLAEVEPEVRLYLGEKLDRDWVGEDNRYRPSFLHGLERFRDDMIRRLGLSVWPVVKPVWARELPPTSFSLEILNQGREHPDAVPIATPGSDALDRVFGEMTASVTFTRVHFVTADRVHHLVERLDKAVAQWLGERYTLTDLKTLLRGVVRPSDEELNAPTPATTRGPGSERPGAVPEYNLRDASWLLASLVFWTHVHGDAVPGLVDGLRATQRARHTPALPAAADGAVASHVARGVRALFSGQVAEADSAFATALRLNPRMAPSYFLAAYPVELRRTLIRRSSAWCAARVVWHASGSDANSGFGDPVARIDIEQLLVDGERDLDADTGRRLRLCLLADYPARYRDERRRVTAELTRRYGAPEAWPPDEAGWFGIRRLADFNVLTDDPGTVSNAVAFLRSGVGRTDVAKARTRVDEILALCWRPGPRRWCWDVLAALGDVRDDPWIALGLASALVRREVPAHVKRGLELASQAAALARRAAPESPASRDAIAVADLYRAEGQLRLAELQAGGDVAEAERTLRRLLDVPHLRGLPSTGLARLLRFRERGADARAVLDSAWKRLPDDSELLGQRLVEALDAGDTERVRGVAMEALDKVRRHPGGCPAQEGFCFLAAMGLLMTDGGQREWISRELLATPHHNVPYVAMMLHSRMADAQKSEARDVLERLWARATPDTWPARLRHGDETAWHEMLIGYATGKVEAARVFGDLEDDRRFAASDLRHVPMTRAGMLSEAYFYDALLGEARGDKARTRAGLVKVVDLQVRHYFEYVMAKYLLGRSGGSP